MHGMWIAGIGSTPRDCRGWIRRPTCGVSTQRSYTPGIALLEASPNYSVGRGTDSPFELVGADWIRGRELANFLNGRFIPGVRAYPTRFRPTSSNFSGKTIDGVRFVITNRDTFDSVRFGLELGYALNKLYPGKIAWQERIDS